jgi:N-acetylglucosaminyl-diphospho-decaprenol L-rhamnosyltransferase
MGSASVYGNRIPRRRATGRACSNTIPLSTHPGGNQPGTESKHHMAAMTTNLEYAPSTSTRVSIIIPLYNQLAFTKGCLACIRATVPEDVEIIMIDNASSDGTSEYLAPRSGIVLITNHQNLGFAGACNQGIRAASGEWIVVMNNDVLLSGGWLAGLLSAAQRWDLQMVSPAIREGILNYDIESYARELTSRMRAVVRKGKVNGICFMAHRRVFDTIGLFDENFRIGQYEDKDLFIRATLAGFRLGTVGSAFLHHFGSATQKTMKHQADSRSYALENKTYFARKWNRPWWKRMAIRSWEKICTKKASFAEKTQYGHTLMEKMIDGQIHYE